MKSNISFKNTDQRKTVDKFSFFILNIFLNSLLAFFTAAILIEAILFLFRIKPGRIAALLRMIPILKLPLDLLLYDFSSWSYTQGINPLHCEEGTRTLSVLFCWINPLAHWGNLPLFSKIQFAVPGNRTFTIADMIGYLMHPHHLQIFTILLIALSLSIFVRRLAIYYLSKNRLSKIAYNSHLITKKIYNPTLLHYLKQSKHPILSSSALSGSPFVVGFISPTIFFPQNLTENLSQKEYEAVLAHEIEHIRHKDPLIRFFLDVISSLFWWVPIRWLRNRIEEGQEIGCDKKCRKYGIDSIDLASALHKSAKESKKHPHQVFAYHLAQHQALTRIQLLLQSQTEQFRKRHLVLSCLAAGTSFLLILFGRFWIF